MEEADQLYRNSIKIANEMQNEAEKTKVRIVAQTKQLVNECDRTFRSVRNLGKNIKYLDISSTSSHNRELKMYDAAGSTTRLRKKGISHARQKL